MKIKGTMVIELTDANTGDVETITEENMVTNAVNHLLGINPMATMYIIIRKIGGKQEVKTDLENLALLWEERSR